MQGASKYDIVLMETAMAGLGGVAATRILRRSSNMTPVIAMTAQIGSDDVATYFECGMDDVLAKPFTCQDMSTVLERHLQHLKLPNICEQSPSSITDNLRLNGEWEAPDEPRTANNCNVQDVQPDFSPPITYTSDPFGAELRGNAIWEFITSHELYARGLDIADVCTRMKRNALWLRDKYTILDVDVQNAIYESAAAGASHNICRADNQDEASLPPSTSQDGPESYASNNGPGVQHKSNATRSPRAAVFVCKLCILAFSSAEEIYTHCESQHHILPHLDMYCILLDSRPRDVNK
ncbi:hypothetical protein PV04_04116 [Phialophora macrospora]|uniref:Response regulatory domain-containing protein n=1 Tax=Phialophora macrospora TaxID=1851006 RepID=A0A0D2FNH5_9EURO|nr:hypothetical protein PV04_04116 [Phialophora macrospora]